MKNNTVTITVEGQVATGKSALVYLLKNIIREAGIEVEFDGGIDFENESQFDKHMEPRIHAIAEGISGKTNVVIKEVQTNRDGV